ncbi:MAG TPA: cytochrome d ubiquinol oxidase subunit II [Humisphaera sp.]|jgi:cytochrome d ubiquinol oxidase subunit II|nr:cytochrome d ubiquinol oxidase subunit II [Humisphaera sp.]
MQTLWFWIFWGMLASFVVFGGIDIGVGILHLIVGRNEAQRTQTIRSIHQVWKPNEVWLVAGGGVMFVAFPLLLATSLSGFYLAIMLVLWLLIGRGLGIELRGRIADPMWRQFWDVAFCVSSGLLAVCLGAALGNFVRGVPLDQTGVFFEPLWTDFRVRSDTGILDWFTVLVGVTAVVALAHHGALWLNAFTEGVVQERSARIARWLWMPLVVILILAATASSILQPQIRMNVAAHPWAIIFPLGAASALIASRVLMRNGRDLQAFIASGASLYAALVAAAFGLHPYVLPARNPALGLTAIAAAAPRESLQLALYWWIPGMLLVAGYFFYVYSKLPPKVSVAEEE